MNLPNFIALCLLVTAWTMFLLGLFFPLSVPLKSPLEVIEQTQPVLDAGTANNPALSLVKNFPWLIPTILFLASAGLSLVLAAAGLTIWHFVGRRRILQIEQEASLQKGREEALQRLLDEHVEVLLGPQDRQREVDVAEMASVLQKLDPGRRHRFDTFRRESHPESTSSGTGPLATTDYTPPFHQKKILARVLALGLALLGVFIILWAMLPLFFTDLISSFYKEAIGFDFEPADAILAMIFIWILALNPLGLSVGFLRLSSIESRLQKAWIKGHDEARDLLLASYRRQLETLTTSDLHPTSSFDTLRILRGLTRIALPELDASGKRTVLELLHGHGLTRKDRCALDPKSMDFSGADLRKIVLHDACLRGADFQQATLAEAELSGADLGGAKLGGADLRSANLQGACLREADLRFTRLHRANLLQADLSGAELKGANLWQAKLRGVDLTHVRIEPAQLAAADR